jgi:phosphoglycerate kinase
MLRSLKDLSVQHQRVLVRVDFNVPLSDGRVANDARLRESLPTLQYLIEQEAKVVLISHLGRPDGRFSPELRMNPVAQRLAELLKRPVRKLDDCIGPAVESAAQALAPGEILLLENVRFHPGEEANDESFAQQLAQLADVYVNDAFGTAHRAHASTYGVAKLLPASAGLLLEREVRMLSRITEAPARPVLAIIGGAKISDKIGVMQDLFGRVDQFLVGGGSAFTFLQARGWSVGTSIVEERLVESAQKLVKAAEARQVSVVLPQDFQIARALKPGVECRVARADQIPAGWMGLDVGPASIQEFQGRVRAAKTIVWAGPLGAFEFPPFNEGTRAVAQTIADSDCFAVIGGGDTAAAVEQAGVAGAKNIYISTGGGATLEFLSGRRLLPIEILKT